MVLSHDTLGCSCIFVASRRPRTLCLRCGVCVDARDARGCVSTIRLGCQASLCCCSSLAAFTRCLQLLCCCCVASA